ncbi:hypothetical protein MPDQ_005183 [Monascus purpureus]|uniref:Uncharacterized protein n=1 Tax=Monascus purpureus TaxID=5098 RepID=A0A507QKL0_MONPU|nr:hypothetical protein MPDQ_005183 [Monascus purpureus]BDD62126.1 hypothetical protein MAP00_007116 [Monascus purpureus]
MKKTKKVAKAKAEDLKQMGDRLPSHVEALPRSLRPPSTTHRQLTELSKDSDIAHGRAERVVTQIDFAAWVADHLESHPAENVRPDSLQKPSSVPLGEGKVASHSASAQKPPVVQAERAEPLQRAPVSPTTIVFKARGTDGEWRKIHELDVDPSDPAAVERLAWKDARNRQATFYDKDLRIITPAQCYDAAVADGTNTVFMDFEGDLAMDEETLASISQELRPESSVQAAKRRH